MTGGRESARRTVAAGTITLLSARLIVAAMAMIFIAISTRILTLREMAVFGAYSILCGTQSMICSLGLLTACTKDLPALIGRGESGAAARLLRTSLLTNACVSAAVACGLAAAARPLSALFLKDESFAPQMRWVALGVFLWNIFEANQISLVALQRFRPYGKANVTCAVAQRGASLALFFLLSRSGSGLTGYIVGYAIGTVTGIGVTFAGLKDFLNTGRGFAPLPPLLRYAAPFYADGFFRYFYTQADQLMIGVFLPPEILALYHVAKRFVQYYQQMIASSIDPVLAKVAEMRSRGAEAVERSLRAASRYFIFIFIPFAFGSAALSGFFLRLAGGAPYQPAAIVLALLSASVAPYAAFNLVTGYVYVLGVPSDRLKHNLVAGVSQLTLIGALLWCTSALGASPLYGAAAIAIARVLSLLAGLAFAQRQLKRYLVPRYDLQALWITLAASALMAAVILAPQALIATTIVVPLFALAGGVLFILVIRPAVREEDLDLLRELLRGRGAPVERFLRRVLLRSAPG